LVVFSDFCKLRPLASDLLLQKMFRDTGQCGVRWNNLKDPFGLLIKFSIAPVGKDFGKDAVSLVSQSVVRLIHTRERMLVKKLDIVLADMLQDSKTL